jgi:4-amino-4-deoxy-L-arabinose transferase-like glycosyltransferase
MQQSIRTTWHRHLALIFLLEVVAVLVWWLYAFQPFDGLSPSVFGDSFDYAQIGRNIWRGGWQQGITTYQVPPLALSVTSRFPFLDVIRAPLYPITLALAFAVFGPWDRTIAVATGALFLLSVPILYLLGRRVFSTTVAFLGTLVYILSDWVLKMSVSGLSEPLFVVLFLAMIYFAYDSAQKPASRTGPLLAGALAGLAYLSRYNTILFVPLLAVYLFLASREHRWRRVLLLFVAWGIVASPWMIRNLIFFHHPLFSMQQWAMLMQTPTYPRFGLWKYASHPSIRAFFIDHWPEIVVKIRDTLLEFYHNLPTDMSLTGGSPYTLMLFVASLFRRLDRPQAALRGLVGAMVITQLLGLTILHLIPRLFFPFYPLFLLFGMDLLVSWASTLLLAGRRFSRMHRLLRIVALTLVVALLVLPVLENLPDAIEQGFSPRLLPVRNLQEYGAAMEYLHANTDPGAVLISDAMDLVSWYGDRACIWTPVALEMVDQIEANVPVEAIYLTQRMFGWPEDEAWYSIYQSQPATILDGRYYLEQVFPDGSLFYRRTR